MKKLYYSIRGWFLYELKYYPRSFIDGIKNLWKWFPVIWKDRNWDGNFIYEVIRFKLNNQAEYIGGKNRHTSAKRDAELMKLTSRLIERCQNEYYDSEYMDYHDSNYIWIETKDYPGSKELDIEVVSEDFDEYFKKYPLQYKRIKSGEINRFDRPFKEKTKQIIAMELAYENQNRCRKLVFKIMERHIDGWWD